jgi:type I restriction enzyme S subunit
MIENLKPYPEYKDSGLPWLGEVPAHWGLERAKRLFRKMNRPSHPEDDVVTCFRDGTVTLRKKRRTSGYTEAIFEHGYQGVRHGDLVISGMDAFAGAIGVSDSDGKSSPVYSVCLAQEGANSHYYAHLLRRMAHSEWILALAKGIRERSTDFRFDVFGAQRLPLPPVPEQAAIARFLAWATNRLDRAIGAKRRIITLLQEQKQAIIHRAVTRGLDPSIPLKDSGIPWLGEIPEHWEVRQVRRVADFITSGSRGWADYYSETGLIFIQSGNLGRDMALNFRYIQHVQPPSGAEGQRTRVKTDDLLICITGALTGNVVHVDTDPPGPSFVNQHVALVRASRQLVEPRFLAFTLRSGIGQSQLKMSEYGGTKQGLGLGHVKNIYFPLPPQQEQQEIVTYLDATLAKFGSTISGHEGEFTLLREYRTRLIADVVTGKLDVREVAARLPEEIEPSIQSDAAGYDGDDAEDDSGSDSIDTEED